MAKKGNPNLYFPSLPDSVDPKLRQTVELLYERVNYLIEQIQGRPIQGQPQTLREQVSKLSVAVTAVQDALTQGQTFVGFGESQPVAQFGGAINWGRVVVPMQADSDQALTQAQFGNRHIEMAGGATLSATRNIVLPNLEGREWVVANLTAGAQSLVFKTPAGTGVTVATNSTAIVRCNGTNIVRVTTNSVLT
jgi:hypothetical protein